MKQSEVVGYIASCCLIITLLPQIYHTLKTRKVNDISYIFLMLQLLTCALFLIYGILINENPLIIANSLVGTQVIIMCILKKSFSK